MLSRSEMERTRSAIDESLAVEADIARRYGLMFAHDVTIRNRFRPARRIRAGWAATLHADWHYFTVTPFLGGKHNSMAIQSAWCISELTRENGATLIWPGSHLSLEVPLEQPESLPPGYIYPGAGPR